MEKKNRPKKNKRKLPNYNYVKYSNIAFQLIAIVLICFFLGKMLDDYMKNLTPWLTIFFSTFSVFATIFLIIKKLLNE